MGKYNDIQQQTIDERIESFLRGTMTEEEEANFKQEIKADPELRRHVMATVSLIKGLREKDSAEEKTIIQNNTKDRARTLLWWACSIAAVFAIFFGYHGYQKDKRFNELSDMVSPYYTEYSMSDFSRGDLDSTTVINLYTLFNNIQKQRNVGDLINRLEPMYSSPRYYGLYAQIFANDIAFNLAIAYIKDDQISKAIPVLEKLEKNNPDTPIAIKAYELLKKLQE